MQHKSSKILEKLKKKKKKQQQQDTMKHPD